MSSTFITIERKLRAKRRSLIKDLQSVSDVAESPDGLNKDDFLERKTHLDPLWKELVATTQECIDAIEEGDSDTDKQMKMSKLI